MASTVRGFTEVGENKSVCLLSVALQTRHELNKKIGRRQGHSQPTCHNITMVRVHDEYSLIWKQSYLHKHAVLDRNSGEQKD